MAEQRSELLKRDDVSFNPSWASLGPSSFDLVDSGLEISIDTVLSRPTLPSRTSKPVKIRLPPYNHSTYLIQVLETAIGDQQHYFRRRDIRAKLARMHQSPDSAQSKDQGWLCHWLSIVALGELYSVNMQSQLDPHNSLASEKAVGAGVHESPGMEYYQQSVSLLQQVAENPDIQYIETLCLLALYAFSINRINTAYMYVGVCMRAALSLDLHRHPQDFPSERSTLPAVELEHQKRLFWTVYYQDLLATSTTGRPWGVLDDEITVDYADSSRLSAEEMLEFFDDQESNIHLELMRLRSQAYSSLYGYAGTAINPYSNISLFDFNLGDCLTQQHLDKIHEFNRALNTWEADLPTAMRIARSWDGSMMNINRINANMYLIYHQSILVIVRPALFNAYNLLCNSQSIPVISHEANRTKAQPSIPAHVLQVFFMSSMSSARETASILQWLRDQGCLPTYSYFVASFSFTATIALYVARALHFAVFHDPYLMSLFPFEQNDHAALETVVQLLNQQASAGNLPAIEFARLSRLLDNNLQALQSAIHTAVNFGDVDLNFLTPEILLSEGDNG
ncbi:hypothetical protein, variant [Exophiala mesophila]|nr:hypothetical protein, variant [Exophiala mesophila]KIV92190.1 hypothetical protein, variant [Exophiala mesophila]